MTLKLRCNPQRKSLMVLQVQLNDLAENDLVVNYRYLTVNRDVISLPFYDALLAHA